MNYKIYLITCLVNNKIYIGKTRKTVEARFKQHIITAISDAPSRKKYYIHNAIKKHGPENFKIEEIDSLEGYEVSKERESYWIKKYNSHNPKIGYNLVIETPDGVEFISESTKKKLSVMIHKAKKPSKLGYGIDTSYYNKTQKAIAYIMINNKKISCQFSNLTKAKIAYDKAALFLYGNDAVVNYPNKKEKFLKQDLKSFYENVFCKQREFLCGYRGIKSSGSKGLFTAVMTTNGKYYNCGNYLNKEDAAMARDIVYFYLNGPSHARFLNFPKIITEMPLSEIENKAKEIIKNNKRIDPKKTEFLGVKFDIIKNQFQANILTQKNRNKILGYYNDKIEAAKSYDKIMFFIHQDVSLLNFPEKTSKISRSELEKFYKNNGFRIKTNNYIGVLKTRNGKFSAIGRDKTGKQINLGTYKDEIEATFVRDKIQLYLHGPNTFLNFPQKIDEYKKDNLESLYQKLTNKFKNKDKTSSKYIGVYKRKDTGQFSVGIKVGDKRIRKDFKNEEDAARFYDENIIKLKGDKAITNFPKTKK